MKYEHEGVTVREKRVGEKRTTLSISMSDEEWVALRDEIGSGSGEGTYSFYYALDDYVNDNIGDLA